MGVSDEVAQLFVGLFVPPRRSQRLGHHPRQIFDSLSERAGQLGLLGLLGLALELVSKVPSAGRREEPLLLDGKREVEDLVVFGVLFADEDL